MGSERITQSSPLLPFYKIIMFWMISSGVVEVMYGISPIAVTQVLNVFDWIGNEH